MSTAQRLYAAFGANLTAQGVSVLIQLASIPIFLHMWTLDQYGGWLIISAIPAYFSLSDVGFLAVTINKMTIISAANNDQDRVNVLFQTAIKLCLFAITGAMVVAVVTAIFLNTGPFSTPANRVALVLLVATAMISMSIGLVDAVFRSQGEFALGVQLGNGARLLEWFGLLGGLFLGKTFLSAAAGQLAGRVAASLACWTIASVRHPEVKWGISLASGKEFRELLRPALSFMAFPLSSAISMQGTTLLVGHFYGAAFLAVFSTYRTVARVLVQAVNIIGRSIWPEISRWYGSGNGAKVMLLYRRSTLASMTVSFLMCLLLYLMGEALLQFWTGGKLPFNEALFYLFLVATTITSAWQMGMVLLQATNSHSSLSLSYLFGSIAALGLTLLLVRPMGVYAPVAGLIGFEILLLVMCLVHVRTFRRRKLYLP